MTVSTRRVFATCSSTLFIAAATTLPALANGKRDDGDEPGMGLGTMNAILIFVLLPIAISGLIALFVLAPGWTKSAKQATHDGFLDDPTALPSQEQTSATQITQ